MADKIRNPNFKIDEALKHVPYIENNIALSTTNEEEVCEFIKDLKTNKAPGSDGISSY